MLERSRWRRMKKRDGTQQSTSCGHQKRGRHALAGDIGQGNAVAILAKIDEVVPVSRDGAGRVPCRFKSETGHERHGLEKKSLLDRARFGRFLLKALSLLALGL